MPPQKRKEKEKGPGKHRAPDIKSSPGTQLPQFTSVINAVASAVRAKYGKGSIARLSDPGAYMEVKKVVPTGLLSLDEAIGVGGIPLGKLVEIYGPESSGKSTLSKHLAAQAQRCGVLPYEIDTEQSGIVAYDQALGISTADALVSQFDTIEQVFGSAMLAIETMEKAHTPGLIIWDSLAATLTEDEFESDDLTTRGYPARAAFLSRNLKKLIACMKSGDVGMVIVNQIRQKIGAPAWGIQTDSPGGKAFRHYAHLRILMSPMGQIKKGDEVIGIKTRARVVKNKMAAPFREANLEIYFLPGSTRLVEAGGEPSKTRTPIRLPSQQVQP